MPAAQSRAWADGEAFSPKAVFGLPDRKDIDERCQAARKFADRAAVADPAVDDIGAADAYAAALAFAACFSLPKLVPDEDKQRYLYLASATALYMAGLQLQGKDADTLLRRAATMARDLGAVGPDRTVVIEHVVGNNEPNSPSTQPLNPNHDYYQVSRSPFGAAHAGRFSPEAEQLLAAIGDYYVPAQSVRPQAGSSSPAPAQPK